jgi:hypothetical protein
MVVGLAGVLAGLIVDASAITVAGAVVGGVGLFLYLNQGRGERGDGELRTADVSHRTFRRRAMAHPDGVGRLWPTLIRRTPMQNAYLPSLLLPQAALIAVLLGGPGADAPPTTLVATLTGQAEVPGPGDADGTGTVTLTLDADKGEVCYEIGITNVEDPTQAHIHQGAASASGGPVLSLTGDVSGSPAGCVKADAKLVGQLTAAPAGYYVNVHSKGNPAGAVRGQLRAMETKPKPEPAN